MTIAIMQPYVFPYLGYFQLINLVDTFVLYDDVAFINRGWVNRNRILVGGQDQLFTVPLVQASQNRLIRDIHVVPDARWQKKLLRTFRHAYGKAPQFAQVYPMLESVFGGFRGSISELAHDSIVAVNAYLGIGTHIVASSSVYDNSTLAGQARILDICRQASAERYVNPIGGQALYDPVAFQSHDMTIRFLKAGSAPYEQNGAPEFVPHLSVIDILMHLPVAAVRDRLKDYALLP